MNVAGPKRARYRVYSREAAALLRSYPEHMWFTEVDSGDATLFRSQGKTRWEMHRWVGGIKQQTQVFGRADACVFLVCALAQGHLILSRTWKVAV